MAAAGRRAAVKQQVQQQGKQQIKQQVEQQAKQRAKQQAKTGAELREAAPMTGLTPVQPLKEKARTISIAC